MSDEWPQNLDCLCAAFNPSSVRLNKFEKTFPLEKVNEMCRQGFIDSLLKNNILPSESLSSFKCQDILHMIPTTYCGYPDNYARRGKEMCSDASEKLSCEKSFGKIEVKCKWTQNQKCAWVPFTYDETKGSCTELSSNYNTSSPTPCSRSNITKRDTCENAIYPVKERCISAKDSLSASGIDPCSFAQDALTCDSMSYKYQTSCHWRQSDILENVHTYIRCCSVPSEWCNSIDQRYIGGEPGETMSGFHDDDCYNIAGPGQEISRPDFLSLSDLHLFVPAIDVNCCEPDTFFSNPPSQTETSPPNSRRTFPPISSRSHVNDTTYYWDLSSSSNHDDKIEDFEYYNTEFDTTNYSHENGTVYNETNSVLTTSITLESSSSSSNFILIAAAPIFLSLGTFCFKIRRGEPSRKKRNPGIDILEDPSEFEHVTEEENSTEISLANE